MKATIEQIETSLQIDEDLALHKVGWVIQRIGWALMFIAVILAALGLFGDGILSDREVVAKGTIISYEHYNRFENNSEISITSRSRNGKIEIEFAEAFTNGFKIEEMSPEPSAQKIVDGGKSFEFIVPAGEGEITLFLTSRKTGKLNTTIKVNDRDFHLDFYTYP